MLCTSCCFSRMHARKTESTSLGNTFICTHSVLRERPAQPVTGAGFELILGREGLSTVQAGAVGVSGGQPSLFVAPPHTGPELASVD